MYMNINPCENCPKALVHTASYRSLQDKRNVTRQLLEGIDRALAAREAGRTALGRVVRKFWASPHEIVQTTTRDAYATKLERQEKAIAEYEAGLPPCSGPFERTRVDHYDDGRSRAYLERICGAPLSLGDIAVSGILLDEPYGEAEAAS